MSRNGGATGSQNRSTNPPMDRMERWLLNEQYSCFRQAHRASTSEHWEENGDELLQTACGTSTESLRFLLEFIRPSQLPGGGRSALVECVRHLPDLGRLQALLKAGVQVDLDESFGSGDGAFNTLVEKLRSRQPNAEDFKNVVDLMCKHGADINKTVANRRGRTALETLCQQYCAKALKLPVGHHRIPTRAEACFKGSVSYTESRIKRSRATSAKHVACLLSNGARLPTLGPGQLHVLLRGRYSGVVQTLIKHGMDPCLLDEEGRPLLAVAVEIGDADMVTFLLSRGCADHWKSLCKTPAAVANTLDKVWASGAISRGNVAVSEPSDHAPSVPPVSVLCDSEKSDRAHHYPEWCGPERCNPAQHGPWRHHQESRGSEHRGSDVLDAKLHDSDRCDPEQRGPEYRHPARYDSDKPDLEQEGPEPHDSKCPNIERCSPVHHDRKMHGPEKRDPEKRVRCPELDVVEKLETMTEDTKHNNPPSYDAEQLDLELHSPESQVPGQAGLEQHATEWTNQSFEQGDHASRNQTLPDCEFDQGPHDHALFEHAQSAGMQRESCNTANLLKMAANFADDTLLRALHDAGIWSEDLSVLHTAALSLNDTVLPFVIQHGKWAAEEVSDSLKLQSATHLLVDCLQIQPQCVWYGYHYTGPVTMEDTLAQLQVTSIPNVFDLDMDREHNWKLARQKFEAAIRRASMKKAEPEEAEMYHDHRVDGHCLKEATTEAEFAQTFEQKIRKDKIRGCHLHAFLVMLRLLPGHSFSTVFVLALVSQIVGDEFMAASDKIHSSTDVQPKTSHAGSLNDSLVSLACQVLTVFCQATRSCLSKKGCNVAQMFLGIQPLFSVIMAALPCQPLHGNAHVSSVLDWMGQCIRWSHTPITLPEDAHPHTFLRDQVEVMAVNMLVHLSKTVSDASSSLQDAVAAFTRSASPARLGRGYLFNALLEQFSPAIFQVPFHARSATKCVHCLEDKHLAATSSFLLSEGVKLPLFSDRVLFALLDEGFFQTVVVLVEHNVDVCVLDKDGIPVLWTAVCKSNAETVRSFLKAGAADHWRKWTASATTGRVSKAVTMEMTEQISGDGTMATSQHVSKHVPSSENKVGIDSAGCTNTCSTTLAEPAPAGAAKAMAEHAPSNSAQATVECPSSRCAMAETECPELTSVRVSELSAGNARLEVTEHSDCDMVKPTERSDPSVTMATTGGISSGTTIPAVEGLPGPNGQAVSLMAELVTTDLSTEAARRNDPGIIEALHKYGVTAHTSALYEAAKHVDGAALTCLLRLEKWKTSDVRNCLLLHSGFQLKEACAQSKNDSCQDDSQWNEGNLFALATDSFERASKLASLVQELEHGAKSAQPPNGVRIVGHCIREAQDVAEFQQLLSTTIPSSRGQPISAVHLHGLLVMERLGSRSCEEYCSLIMQQLWAPDSPHSSVQGALAAYDLILHYIDVVTGDNSSCCYSADHQFWTASSLPPLMEWLLPKLSPGHCVTLLPVFQWLHSLIAGPLCKDKHKLLCTAAKMFRFCDETRKLCPSTADEELRQGVKIFADRAKSDMLGGSELLMAMLKLEAETPPDGSAEDSRRHYLAAVASTLFELGLPLPKLSGELIHHLLRPQFPAVLDVFVSRGLNVWTRNSFGRPLLCSAVRRASADTLHVLLRGLTAGLPENCSDEEVKSVYLQQLEDNGGDQWDLWSLAVDRCSMPIALVLNEHRIPASRKALLLAAIQEDEEVFELVLNVHSWPAIEQSDAFHLHSAYCIYEGLGQTATYGSFKLRKDEDVAGSVSTILDKALPLFRKALQFSEYRDTPGIEPSSARKLHLAGSDFAEARTEQEFLEGAEKLLPTVSKRQLITGTHIHGLLVMERLIPHHPLCYEYFQQLCQLMTGRWSFHIPFDDTRPVALTPLSSLVSPVTACYQMIQHFLCVCQGMSGFSDLDKGLREYSDGPLRSAIYMAIQLLYSGVLIDTTEVFKAAAHIFASSPTDGRYVRRLMARVRNLLLVMCMHKKSSSVMRNLTTAVQLVVNACAQHPATKTTFLHLLVNAWSGNGGPRAQVQEGLSPDQLQLGMIDDTVFLARELLSAGANPDALNESDKTVAHCIIDCCRDHQASVEEGLVLLRLLDEYGIHWDAFYGKRHPLVEHLEMAYGMMPFATHLKDRLATNCKTLECLAAQAASQVDYSMLPKRIRQFVEIHKPPQPLLVPITSVQASGDSDTSLLSDHPGSNGQSSSSYSDFMEGELFSEDSCSSDDGCVYASGGAECYEDCDDERFSDDSDSHNHLFYGSDCTEEDSSSGSHGSPSDEDGFSDDDQSDCHDNSTLHKA